MCAPTSRLINQASRQILAQTWSMDGVSYNSEQVRSGSATMVRAFRRCTTVSANSSRLPRTRWLSRYRPRRDRFRARHSNEFMVSNGQASAPAIFIFATQDGLIVGWNPNIGGTNATVPANFTIKPGASYTGLAIATDAKSGQTFLYAADDSANRQIDMYNSSYTRVQSFGDTEIPSNYAPYGIQAVNGQIWVTYTPLNKAQSGVVDIFNTDGTLAKHDAVHGPLHSPWGIALAPADFGPMSNAILISNNTSRGRVNAFDPNSGEFLGPLRDASGKAIEIDNVWAIQFGHDGGPGGTPHNSLFFTAGPDGYAHGLFGVITSGH